MRFCENLQELRKKEGLSQEALADKLNVTRQTIYKWETGATYPEMDKLVDISKVFGISIEQLVNGEVSEETVSKDVVIRETKKFAHFIGLGVLLILIGVAVMVLLTTYNIKEMIGVTILLGLVFIAVLIFVLISINYDYFKKNNKFEIEFTKREINLARKNFVMKLIAGLACIFLGVILVVIGGFTENDDIAVRLTSALLLLVGFGVYLIIESSIQLELRENTKKALTADSDKPKNTKTGKACGVIMMLATIIFLLLGFIWDLWEWSWIVFPVGGISCGIVSTIFDEEDKPTEETVEKTKE